jgi:V-type H+-transporting ATPase subunit H
MTEKDDLNISIDAPIISTHNDYLLDQSNLIKSRTIPWEGYQKASLITEKELTHIREYSTETTVIFPHQNGQEYVGLFLGLLGKLSRVDTIQNILVLIDDFLSQRHDAINLFLEYGKDDVSVVFYPFIRYMEFTRLLQKEDEYIQLKSAKILTYLLAY